MVITIEGTNNGNNGASTCAALLASLGVISKQKRTLVLQFINHTNNNVENKLIGKKISNNQFDSEVIDISSGIDALFIYSNGTRLTPNLFSECSKTMVNSNTRNMFDVITCSKKTNFEEDIKSVSDDTIESIIKSANDIYHLVIILLPSKNTKLCTRILKFSDVNLVCIKQQSAEEYLSIKDIPGCENKREYVVCTRLDDNSKFNKSYLAKQYDKKEIYSILDNSNLKDAVIEGNILNFVGNNYKNSSNDSNYTFFTNLSSLLSEILGDRKEKTPLETFDIESLTPIEFDENTDIELSGINESDIKIETKKKLFGKKTIKTIESAADNSPYLIRRQKPKKKDDNSSSMVFMSKDVYDNTISPINEYFESPEPEKTNIDLSENELIDIEESITENKDITEDSVILKDDEFIDSEQSIEIPDLVDFFEDNEVVADDNSVKNDDEYVFEETSDIKETTEDIKLDEGDDIAFEFDDSDILDIEEDNTIEFEDDDELIEFEDTDELIDF